MTVKRQIIGAKYLPSSRGLGGTAASAMEYSAGLGPRASGSLGTRLFIYGGCQIGAICAGSSILRLSVRR
jgi:hypothetical protein